MKRGAEKQIGKGDTEHDGDEPMQTGFARAGDSVLAGRQIKGMPKRGGAASSGPTLTLTPASTVAPASKFNGFTGFGQPASKSTAFAFSAPVPAAADNAFATTNAFAQFTSPPTTVSEVPGTPLPEDDPDLVYFLSLRGLNRSFQQAISSSIDGDPFQDLQTIFDMYKTLRRDIKKNLDDALVETVTQPPVKEVAAPKPPASLAFGTPSQTKVPVAAKPPVAPTSLAAFGSTAKASIGDSFAGTNPLFGGWTPSSSPGPLTFGAKTQSLGAKTESSESIPPIDETKSVPETKSSSSIQTTETNDSPQSSQFASFGSSTVIPKALEFKPFAAADSTTVKPASAFGTGAFGISGSQFGGAATTKPAETGPPPSNPFGVNSSSPFGKSLFGTGSPSKAEKPSPFGSATSTFPMVTSAGTFAGFGKGNLGNPVGFGFGSSTPATGNNSLAASIAGGSTLGGSSFGSSATPPSKMPTEDGDANNADEHDDSAALPTKEYNNEAAGEEDEETLYETKCKVYKFQDTPEEKKWVELGVGMVRVKKNKNSSARRVLARNSSTGKIMMNSGLYSHSEKPKADNKVISIAGQDDGKPAMFRVRLPTAGDAEAFKKAVDKEIAAVG